MGWTELMVVGIVALIVVGPEDLPQMFRKVGEFTGKARGMAREFSKAMNDAADQAGVREIDKTIRAASNPTKFGTDSLKKATGLGPETSKLSAEREAARQKIHDAAAQRAQERRDREAAAAEMAEDEADALEADARLDATPEPAPPPAPPAAEPEPRPVPAGAGASDSETDKT
ncbi:twin-arginine translocation protein TatB [Oceanicola granulosus HTCC2516]|uniref:Twin-arginine translocation protein TatB n=2 Tax=Oceanicola granulosus TaxID=252302 RepID=Q2CFR8_OCEGH|nr:twin-arginine translocation protein TatB [Oceanicola granulosus HTCC2516]